MSQTEIIQRLDTWCKENDVKPDKLTKIYEMLIRGGKSSSKHKCQNPEWYIVDEYAKGWHSRLDYPWVELLEKNYLIIREEATRAFSKKKSSVHPENDTLVNTGTWNTYFFFKNGIKYDNNHFECPNTSAVLSQIYGTEIAGRTYFSEMTPGTHIGKHCGPHNFKLRTQLGLVIPNGAIMKVADEPRQWVNGKCFVFDDSFEHEAMNYSDASRLVLIVDVWNPSLSSEERLALEHIMPRFYKRS